MVKAILWRSPMSEQLTLFDAPRTDGLGFTPDDLARLRVMRLLRARREIADAEMDAAKVAIKKWGWPHAQGYVVYDQLHARKLACDALLARLRPTVESFDFWWVA